MTPVHRSLVGDVLAFDLGEEMQIVRDELASRRAGRIVAIESAETIADGIAVKRLGDLTFPLIERYVDDIVAVDEAEIAGAVHLLLERQKLLAEGAGAVALAAVLAGRVPLRGDDVAVMVLSGGNIDVNLVSRIIDRGLVADGRLARGREHVAAIMALLAQHGVAVRQDIRDAE